MKKQAILDVFAEIDRKGSRARVHKRIKQWIRHEHERKMWRKLGLLSSNQLTALSTLLAHPDQVSVFKETYACEQLALTFVPTVLPFPKPRIRKQKGQERKQLHYQGRFYPIESFRKFTFQFGWYMHPHHRRYLDAYSSGACAVIGGTCIQRTFFHALFIQYSKSYVYWDLVNNTLMELECPEGYRIVLNQDSYTYMNTENGQIFSADGVLEHTFSHAVAYSQCCWNELYFLGFTHEGKGPRARRTRVDCFPRNVGARKRVFSLKEHIYPGSIEGSSVLCVHPTDGMGCVNLEEWNQRRVKTLQALPSELQERVLSFLVGT